MGYKHDPFVLLEVLNRIVEAINMDIHNTARKDTQDLFSQDEYWEDELKVTYE